MEALIWIVAVALVVGGVMWNHRTAAAAFVGIESEVGASPSEVRSAIERLYLSGAKGKARATVTFVKVTPAGEGFDLSTKFGDEGTIALARSPSGGTLMSASATRLFVGNPARDFGRHWIVVAGQKMSHGIYKVLGIRPSARRWKGFVHRLDGRVRKQLNRSQ